MWQHMTIVPKIVMPINCMIENHWKEMIYVGYNLGFYKKTSVKMVCLHFVKYLIWEKSLTSFAVAVLVSMPLTNRKNLKN